MYGVGVCVSVWVSPDVSGVYLRYFTTVFYTHTNKFLNSRFYTHNSAAV